MPRRAMYYWQVSRPVEHVTERVPAGQHRLIP
jgi:hypothetical protein